MGVCDPLPKTLTLFKTKICDIPYPIYDLNLTSKSCFRPALSELDPSFRPILNYRNLVSASVDFLFDDDETVASSQKYTHINARVQKPHPMTKIS